MGSIVFDITKRQYKMKNVGNPSSHVETKIHKTKDIFKKAVFKTVEDLSKTKSNFGFADIVS